MFLTELDHRLQFPPAQQALTEPNGLLAVGGDLSPERLMLAYQQGIFPWFSPDDPLLWWSPDPRAVLLPQQLHISRSLQKFLRRCDYQVTLNHAFTQVIAQCATIRGEDQIWITPEMQSAYCELHQLGFAHSVEVWHNRALIGGLYGVAQGKIFCGESMFSRQSNASKVAMVAFCRHFIACGGELIDSQILNDHTASLGAFNIARDDYLQLLQQLQQQALTANCWHNQTLNY